jgi:hypothetical protein
MPQHHVLLMATLALTLAVSGRGASAEFVPFFDDFNSENGGHAALNYYGFSQWEVTRGSVDLHGGGSEFDYLPGHGMYVDLDGTTQEAGRLETRRVFDLGIGTYQLGFDLAGSQRGDVNTVGVSLGDVFEESFTLDGDAPFTPIVRTFGVSTPTRGRLIFDHLGGDDSGLLLNNVRLVPMTDPVVIPLPAAWAAGGALLLVLGGAHRRRKAWRSLVG